MQEAASMPQLSGPLTIRRTCFLVPFLEGLFLLPEVKKKKSMVSLILRKSENVCLSFFAFFPQLLIVKMISHQPHCPRKG